MKRLVVAALIVPALFGMRASAQVKQSKEQIMFYTAKWQGERFADGRPKISDELLKRAIDCSVEDIWGYLRQRGYQNQFEGDWKALHIDKPFAGRAVTTQYMPTRPDIAEAETAEGKAEGRIAFNNNNSWPINELVKNDIYVADGYGKIVDGTLIGSNLGSGIAAHSQVGFIFYGGIRDEEENSEIPNFNGFYKGYDPSAWQQEMLTSINAPVRIGRAVVLPGDLVLAKPQGVLFIPAILAAGAIASAEFTGLMDAYNFELNSQGKNGGQFENGWDAAKYGGLKKWVAAHPDKLKMTQAEFDAALAARVNRLNAPPPPPRPSPLP